MQKQTKKSYVMIQSEINTKKFSFSNFHMMLWWAAGGY